jgi:hypothetical protein
MGFFHVVYSPCFWGLEMGGFEEIGKWTCGIRKNCGFKMVRREEKRMEIGSLKKKIIEGEDCVDFINQ